MYTAPMSKVAIHSNQEVVPIDRGRMREIARTLLAGEEIGDFEISLAFVDNPTIHVLNKRYSSIMTSRLMSSASRSATRARRSWPASS